MKATGVVRRMDDLGRIVIPKEIRRTIGIREGKPMEIYIEGNDTVCFRKYKSSLTDEFDRRGETIQKQLDVDDDDNDMREIYLLICRLKELVKSKV